MSDRYTVASYIYIYGFPNEGLSGAIVAGAFELDKVNTPTLNRIWERITATMCMRLHWQSADCRATFPHYTIDTIRPRYILKGGGKQKQSNLLLLSNYIFKLGVPFSLFQRKFSPVAGRIFSLFIFWVSYKGSITMLENCRNNQRFPAQGFP